MIVGTWKRILIRSSGATAVLAIPPVTPPAISSLANKGIESIIPFFSSPSAMEIEVEREKIDTV
jgi:hypothetical protein